MSTKTARRSITLDRGPPGDVVAIHTVEQLGPNMSKLPNGSLLCANVPIARVGWMMYGPGETPIEVGDQGVAYIERTADTLFDPVCMGSFMGAAVVDEHPDVDVIPENWKKLAKGFATTNVRRGTDAEDTDVLLADLIVTDADLIEAVMSGKREVSCGYAADYTQTADGVGTQTNIIGNHIALVEKGRCGPRCAIGDQEFQPQPKKEPEMAATQRLKIVSPNRRAVLDVARKRVKDAEEELQALENPAAEESDVLNEGDGNPGGDTHIHIHTEGTSRKALTEDDPDADPAATSQEPAAEGGDMEARVAAIEQALTALTDMVQSLIGGSGDADDAAPKPDDDKDPDDDDTTDEFPDMKKDDKEKKDDKATTKDSAALETGYKQVMAQAEVLVPGFRMPTFDAKAKRAATIDKMCGARRSALTACYATADGATLINSVAGKDTLDLAKLDCRDTAILFKAAAGAKALLNNAAATKDSKSVVQEQQTAGVPSLASINEANQSFWKGRTQ